MKAILTEKPSVAMDIARVLKIYEKHNGYLTGNGYMITWALGHLVALANPDTYEYYHFPMIPTKFKLLPRTVKTGNGYEPDKAAVKQLKVISDVFSKCDEIIVATDAGREGELIFRYIYQYLHCKKPFSRLWINSMTDKAIIDGFNHLRDGNDFNNLYLAAEARSKADWLIGMNASQALFLATNEKNNSLGRVQTPTLAMICNRYLQNTSFKSLPYWVYKILIEKNGQSFRMTSKEKVDDKVKAEAFFKSLTEKPVAEITKVGHKEVSEKPPLLYDLTNLQKQKVEVSTYFNLSSVLTDADTTSKDGCDLDMSLLFYFLTDSLKKNLYKYFGFGDNLYLSDENKFTIISNLTERQKTILIRQFVIGKFNQTHSKIKYSLIKQYCELLCSEKANSVINAKSEYYNEERKSLVEKIEAHKEQINDLRKKLSDYVETDQNEKASVSHSDQVETSENTETEPKPEESDSSEQPETVFQLDGDSDDLENEDKID